MSKWLFLLQNSIDRGEGVPGGDLIVITLFPIATNKQTCNTSHGTWFFDSFYKLLLSDIVNGAAYTKWTNDAVDRDPLSSDLLPIITEGKQRSDRYHK